VINREQSLRRKRLVDLEKINVPEGKSGQVEDAGNGVGGADTHDAGGTPMVAAVTNLPRMGRLRRFATERRARTTAAAPSETWDALPREGGRG
jgi:hypothetical protein